MLRTQNPEFRFQYEESGMWEAPQCADSGGPLAERPLQRIENPKSEVPNSKREARQTRICHTLVAAVMQKRIHAWLEGYGN